MAFVGFDNIAVAANAIPPLTSLSVDSFDPGYPGVQRVINGTGAGPASLVPVQLVVRASTKIRAQNSLPDKRAPRAVRENSVR